MRELDPRHPWTQDRVRPGEGRQADGPSHGVYPRPQLREVDGLDRGHSGLPADPRGTESRTSSRVDDSTSASPEGLHAPANRGSPAAATGSVCSTCLLAVGTNLGLRETAEATTTHRSGSWCASPAGTRRATRSTEHWESSSPGRITDAGPRGTVHQRPSRSDPLALPHTTLYAFDLGKSGRHGVRPFPDPCNIGSELLGQFRLKVTSKPCSAYPSGFRR